MWSLENIIFLASFIYFTYINMLTAEEVLEQVEYATEDHHYGNLVLCPGVCCLVQFFY